MRLEASINMILPTENESTRMYLANLKAVDYHLKTTIQGQSIKHSRCLK